ncbi:MAG: CAP domain-containing protein [Paracoccus hibiscisoli]|uniref:CAP domain-containing protein n=1 Tax=Paracoccus hibiscisoli TaxID=2023261 RepID=UPI0039189E01
MTPTRSCLAALAAMMLTAPVAWGAPRCAEPSVADSQAMAVAITRMRAQAGLAAVGADPALTQAAARQACDMARRGRLSHEGGGGLSARTRAAGYPTALAAENIAAGQADASSALAAWAGSRGHRANLLHRRVRHIGIGQAVGTNGQPYWALVLAAPR